MVESILGNPQVLSDVKDATRQKRGADAPAHDESIIRSPINEPYIDRFVVEAEAAGMKVTRTTGAGLADLISSLVDQADDGPVLLEPALAEVRSELNKLPGCLAEPTEDELFSAGVGVVSADAAIAATGSIVRAAGPARPRSFALAPMTVIIVLEASKIIGDLYDWMATQDPDSLASEIVLITGPSKTADIGMNLVTGIHGPGIVHIAVVEDA